MQKLILHIRWFMFKVLFYGIWKDCHKNTAQNYYRLGNHKISPDFLDVLEEMADKEEVIELKRSEGVITFHRIGIQDALPK